MTEPATIETSAHFDDFELEPVEPTEPAPVLSSDDER